MLEIQIELKTDALKIKRNVGSKSFPNFLDNFYDLYVMIINRLEEKCLELNSAVNLASPWSTPLPDELNGELVITAALYEDNGKVLYRIMTPWEISKLSDFTISMDNSLIYLLRNIERDGTRNFSAPNTLEFYDYLFEKTNEPMFEYLSWERVETYKTIILSKINYPLYLEQINA